jgi:hypothetical protein
MFYSNAFCLKQDGTTGMIDRQPVTPFKVVPLRVINLGQPVFLCCLPVDSYWL